MDLAKEVEIVDGLALGDTLLLERGARPDRLRHLPHARRERGAGRGRCYVKFLAIDPQHRKVEHLEQFVAAIEEPGAGARAARGSSCPCTCDTGPRTARWSSAATRSTSPMVRMQQGKQEDYEDPADLVLDDWR